MAASIISAPTILQSLTRVSYALTWAGAAPVGTVSVEASDDVTLDAVGGIANPGTWNPIPFDLAGALVTSIPLSGNSGNGYIDIDGIGAYATRLRYTRTSGTGTLGVIVNGKVS